MPYDAFPPHSLCIMSSRVLMLRPEELKENFEEEAPASAREGSKYARNFLEYCCFRALAVATQVRAEETWIINVVAYVGLSSIGDARLRAQHHSSALLQQHCCKKLVLAPYPSRILRAALPSTDWGRDSMLMPPASTPLPLPACACAPASRCLSTCGTRTSAAGRST